MYRCLSQSTSEIESFLSYLEDLLSNTLCSKPRFNVILGDLNARSSALWSEDITTLHGTQTDFLTTMHGFKQITFDPAHILPQSSSCIDFYRPTQLCNSLWHTSFLHPNCQHKITFCKLNLKVE